LDTACRGMPNARPGCIVIVRVVSEETAGAKPGDKIARIVRKPLLSGVVVASFPYPVT
jgi:hypothetical protein